MEISRRSSKLSLSSSEHFGQIQSIKAQPWASNCCTMSTSWYGSRVIELINARSLFIKVWPAPINLTERRAVLRALQRYGDIEVFKRLTVRDSQTFSRKR